MSKKFFNFFKYCLSLILPLALVSIPIFVFFHPRPDTLDIQKLLESKYLFSSGNFLNNQNFGLISYSSGKPVMSLSSLLFSPLSNLPNFELVTQISNLLLVCGSLFFYLKVFMPKATIQNIVVYSSIFFLAPFIWIGLINKPDLCLTLFFSGSYLYFRSGMARYLAMILLLLSSPISWIITPFLIIYQYLRDQKTLVIQMVISVMLIIFFLTKPLIIQTYFPIFIPETHGFFTQIHRQADLNFDTPWLGKILYNKYIVVPQLITQKIASYLDWDRYVFIGNSGKSDNRPYDLPQLTLFEIPLIIFVITKLFLSKPKQLLIILSAIASVVIADNFFDPGFFFWFVVSLLSVVGLHDIFLKYKQAYYLLISLIIISKIITLNLGLQSYRLNTNIYNAYKEVSLFIKNKDKDIIFSDTMGQPHVFLTYFGVIKPEELANNLGNTTSKDKDMLLQPNQIGNLYFGSYQAGDLFKKFPIKDYSYLTVSNQVGDLDPLVCDCVGKKLESNLSIKITDKTVNTNFVYITQKP